jgi:transposase
MIKPESITAIPPRTLEIARAAFPKPNVYMRLRDESGALYTQSDFTALFSHIGQPAISPWRLALITIFQFLENLSDRQAADAVRTRIDWKYARSFERTDPGFDFSVLSEFRTRLMQFDHGQVLLDTMLTCFKDKGVLKARGRKALTPRTSSPRCAH